MFFHSILKTSMHLQAEPERVFPLLCPVKEALWLPGWSAEIIHSESGLAELGCVFKTRDEDGRERVWTVSRYEPEEGKIQYVQFVAGRCVTRLDLALEPVARGCLAQWTVTVAGLVKGHQDYFAHYDETVFLHRMAGLERHLANHLAVSW